MFYFPSFYINRRQLNLTLIVGIKLINCTLNVYIVGITVFICFFTKNQLQPHYSSPPS